MKSVDEVIDQITHLVSLPDIYLRVQQLINDPNASLGDIGKVIGIDPALTARLLKIANSPFFGPAAKIETINRAISIMGTRQLHDLLLATSVATAFNKVPDTSMNIARFWIHSIRCAVSARLLGFECNVLDSERVFVAGLLHDIGHMVMYQLLPQESADAAATALATRQPLSRSERQSIGFDYTEIGSALLRAWNLPAMLQETVAYQNEPDKAESFPFETAIVHIATKIAAAADTSGDGEPLLDRVAPFAVQLTRITDDKVANVQAKLEQHVTETVSLLTPGIGKAS